MEVTVHSGIASLGNWRGIAEHASVSLWYFVRGLDVNGCGKSEFVLAEAASILQKRPATIRKYLMHGKKAGLFRHYSIKQGIVKVFYRSRNKVAALLNLESWGTSVKLRLEQLSNLRFHVLEGVAKAACEWGFRSARATSQKALILRTQSVVQASLDRLGAIGQRKMVFLNSSYLPYGSSQAKIAKVLGVSIRTVNRNLSWFTRLNAGLPSIPRVQLAIHAPEYNAAFLSKDWQSISALHLIHPPGSSRAYRLYPCLYKTDIELKNQRWARRKYKEFLSENPQISPVAGGEITISKTYSGEQPVENSRGGDTM
jgi:hypothetical protein